MAGWPGQVLSCRYHIFSITWYENSRIGKNQIGKILPALCKVANVPRMTNASVRPTSIRAMRRAGFERTDVAFVSGHKSIDTLSNYDHLTVYDRTKIALAMQKGHATLDGDQLNLDQLARGEKRKAADPAPTTSKDDPAPSASKKVTFDEETIERAEFVIEDSGLGMENMFENVEVVTLPVVTGVQEANQVEESKTIEDHEPALPSSQAHNVAQLIREHMNTSKEHMNTSKELINNYIAAMKKK